MKLYYPKICKRNNLLYFVHKWHANLLGFLNICKLPVAHTSKVMQSKIFWKVVLIKYFIFYFIWVAKKLQISIFSKLSKNAEKSWNLFEWTHPIMYSSHNKTAYSVNPVHIVHHYADKVTFPGLSKEKWNFINDEGVYCPFSKDINSLDSQTFYSLFWKWLGKLFFLLLRFPLINIFFLIKHAGKHFSVYVQYPFIENHNNYWWFSVRSFLWFMTNK